MAIVWVYAMVRVDPTLSTLTIESARVITAFWAIFQRRTSLVGTFNPQSYYILDPYHHAVRTHASD